jgi:hypothetical protein
MTFSTSASTPEPHFDDERTMLSARPVVPLEQINAKARHRRNWFLGGAFAIAMMLGAASALVASYIKLRNAAPPVAEVEVTPAPVEVAESVPAESPVVEETTETEQAVPEESPTTEATPERRTVKTVAKRAQEIPEPRDTEKVSESEDLNQIRAAVLYDEWEERRARRAARRERRRLDRYNHRDLSNLDEIFEGRRRRVNPY